MRVALPDSTSGTARRQLRAALVARRRSVPPHERSAAALRVARHVAAALPLRADSRIAIYAACRGELDTTPLIALARERGCRIYLPRIDRRRTSRAMTFVQMRGALRVNRLGIDEPQASATLGARWFDLVFLPLVGFDARGLRLGAGGGYYDRAFAFRRLRQVWHTPRLIGLAYAFQQLPHIEAAPHDVPLDAVVTEAGMLTCTTG